MTLIRVEFSNLINLTISFNLNCLINFVKFYLAVFNAYQTLTTSAVNRTNLVTPLMNIHNKCSNFLKKLLKSTQPVRNSDKNIVGFQIFFSNRLDRLQFCFHKTTEIVFKDLYFMYCLFLILFVLFCFY